MVLAMSFFNCVFFHPYVSNKLYTMSYHTDNRIGKYVQGYSFLSFAKKFGSKYDKKFINKGISASKRLKTAATKSDQSKYGKIFKKGESKIGKLVGKQLLEKIIPAAIHVAESKIAEKITSLKVSGDQELQEEIEEEQEIIIPPHQRQKVIDDLRLF